MYDPAPPPLCNVVPCPEQIAKVFGEEAVITTVGVVVTFTVVEALDIQIPFDPATVYVAEEFGPTLTVLVFNPPAFELQV